MIYLIFYALDKTSGVASKIARTGVKIVSPPFLYVSTKCLERLALYHQRRNSPHIGVDAAKAKLDVGRKDWWNQN
jgi:hypothetical protein